MITEKEIKKIIKDEYPNGVDLVYINYNDDISENKELCEELAQTGYLDSLWEDDWIFNYQFESIDQIILTLFNDEQQEEILTDDELREFTNNLLQEIDTSTPEEYLLKNTGKRYYYYDLNIEVSLQGQADYTNTAIRLAKKLKIDYQKNKKAIIEMLSNSFDGGQLVVLFVADPRYIKKELEKENTITFNSNAEILVIDRVQGGGTAGEGFIPVEGEIKLAFNRENLHDDEGESGYSYSGDVCGMTKGEEADFNIGYSKRVKKARVNMGSKARSEQDKQFEKTFREGKCTFGDIKYSRHKNKIYINDYPCGNKCLDCGHFWID